jgi:hypothetical protein
MKVRLLPEADHEFSEIAQWYENLREVWANNSFRNRSMPSLPLSAIRDVFLSAGTVLLVTCANAGSK